MKLVDIKNIAYSEQNSKVADIKKQVYQFILQEIKLQKFLKGQRYHFQMSLNLIELFEYFLPIYKKHLPLKDKAKLYEYYITQIKQYTSNLKKVDYRQKIAQKHQKLKSDFKKSAEYSGLIHEEPNLIRTLFFYINKAVSTAKDWHFLQNKNKFLLKEALINEIISSAFISHFSNQEKKQIIKNLEKNNYIFDYNQYTKANRASLSFLSNPVRYLSKKETPAEFCHYLHMKIVNQMSEEEIIHHLSIRKRADLREELIRALIASKTTQFLTSYDYKLNFIVKENIRIAIYNKLTNEYYFNSEGFSISMLLHKIATPLAEELAIALNFNRYGGNYFRYFLDDLENFLSKKNESHKTEFFISEQNLNKALSIGISEYNKKIDIGSQMQNIIFTKYLNKFIASIEEQNLTMLQEEIDCFQLYYLPEKNRFRLRPRWKQKFIRSLQIIRSYSPENFDLALNRVSKRISLQNATAQMVIGVDAITAKV